MARCTQTLSVSRSHHLFKVSNTDIISSSSLTKPFSLGLLFSENYDCKGDHHYSKRNRRDWNAIGSNLEYYYYY
jgi:hypothetical protein